MSNENENENAFVAKLIKAKRESQSGGIWLQKFMQIYFSPNTPTWLDSCYWFAKKKKKIETCSSLICIICPVCLVKGFNQKGETFHSLALSVGNSIILWPKLICQQCIVDFDSPGCLPVSQSVYLFARLRVCECVSVFSQANILPMSGLTATKNQVKIFENWFCRRTWQRQIFNELKDENGGTQVELEMLFDGKLFPKISHKRKDLLHPLNKTSCASGYNSIPVKARDSWTEKWMASELQGKDEGILDDGVGLGGMSLSSCQLFSTFWYVLCCSSFFFFLSPRFC